MVSLISKQLRFGGFLKAPVYGNQEVVLGYQEVLKAADQADRCRTLSEMTLNLNGPTCWSSAYWVHALLQALISSAVKASSGCAYEGALTMAILQRERLRTRAKLTSNARRKSSPCDRMQGARLCGSFETCGMQRLYVLSNGVAPEFLTLLRLPRPRKGA